MHLVMIKGTPAEKELQELKEFAEKPENILNLGKDKTQDDINKLVDGAQYTRQLILKDFIGQIGTYRICFSIDLHQAVQQESSNPLAPMEPVEVKVRHASIQRAECFPDPFAVFTVCKFLGFTGSFNDWTFTPHPEIENLMAVVQSIDFDKPHQIVVLTADQRVRQ